MCKKTERSSSALLAPLVVLGLCLAIYMCLWSSPLVVFLVIAALTVGVILLDKTGNLEAVYELTEEHGLGAAGVLVLFALVLPFLLRHSSYVMHIAVMGCLHAVVALGLNFQIGSAGMVNFAPAAFMGMGAYTSAILSVKFYFSPWVGTVVAIFSAAGLGLLIGYPTLKTRGYYLSLVTLALQTIFTLLIVNTRWLGGPNGIAGVTPYQVGRTSFGTDMVVGGLELPRQTYYLYLLFIGLGITAWISGRIYRSRVGLALNAVEQDEVVAASQGVNLARMKLLAFSLGAAFAGLAGAIYAHYVGFIGVEDFDFNKSLMLICMVILGGMDNVPGVALGAVLLTIVDEKLRDFAEYRMLVYGVVLMCVLLLRPQGILPKGVRKYRLPGLEWLEHPDFIPSLEETLREGQGGHRVEAAERFPGAKL